MATSTTTMEATRIGDGPAAIGAADGGGVAAGAAARRHRGVVKKAVRIPPTRGWGGGGGGGGDDDDGELRLILAGQDASSVRLRWVGGGGDTAHFVVYGNEALGFRKVYGGP